MYVSFVLAQRVAPCCEQSVAVPTCHSFDMANSPASSVLASTLRWSMVGREPTTPVHQRDMTVEDDLRTPDRATRPSRAMRSPSGGLDSPQKVTPKNRVTRASSYKDSPMDVSPMDLPKGKSPKKVTMNDPVKVTPMSLKPDTATRVKPHMSMKVAPKESMKKAPKKPMKTMKQNSKIMNKKGGKSKPVTAAVKVLKTKFEKKPTKSMKLLKKPASKVRNHDATKAEGNIKFHSKNHKEQLHRFLTGSYQDWVETYDHTTSYVVDGERVECEDWPTWARAELQDAGWVMAERKGNAERWEKAQ